MTDIEILKRHRKRAKMMNHHSDDESWQIKLSYNRQENKSQKLKIEEASSCQWYDKMPLENFILKFINL